MPHQQAISTVQASDMYHIGIFLSPSSRRISTRPYQARPSSLDTPDPFKISNRPTHNLSTHLLDLKVSAA